MRMFIKMGRANVRIRREMLGNFERDYFQIEVDGKLEVSSCYGSSMANLMVESGDLPIGIVRNLSIRGLCSSDYHILDREIIEDSGDKKKILLRGSLFVSDLKQKINDAFMIASMGN